MTPSQLLTQVHSRVLKLDPAYLEDWLAQFAEFLERPEILTQYQSIQAHIAQVLAKLDGE